MTKEAIRPVKRWAVGHPQVARGLVVVRISCANRPDSVYALTPEQARELADALIAEATLSN